MNELNVVLENGHSQNIRVPRLPDDCPVCRRSINPRFITGHIRKTSYSRELQAVFECPHISCHSLFIGYFNETNIPNQGTHYSFSKAEPNKTEPVEFSDTVKITSNDFCTIYNQAHSAEEARLTEICGAGYRKSLEFLIKDYLIKKDPTKAEKIKKEQLAPLIQKRVAHTQLKEVAERAAWLGNDETHYERRWVGKDVTDLKLLIDLTVRWIEMEETTAKLMVDMPDK